MKVRARLADLLLIAACGGTGVAIAAQDAPLPADVAAFIERRQGCDHFRGEGAYDEERRLFLLEQMKATCTGTDAALKDLRRRHARSPAVIAALGEYEWPIEYDTPTEDAGSSVPERAAGQAERDEQAKTIVVNDVTIPVTVNLENVALNGEHEITIIDQRENMQAILDSYASRPQGMSRCQAGHERYLRLIDIAAKKERYATLVESCMENVGADDQPITWSADGRTLTVNLYTAPPITLNIATDGTVTPAQ